MLVQKEVKSKKTLVLILIIIATLGVSGYLLYYNINYSVNRGSNSQIFSMMDNSMKNSVGSSSGYEEVIWKVLGLKSNDVKNSKLDKLQRHVLPLSLEGLAIGHPDIFR
ncbi:MAG: hypothetical protein WC310_04100 [Patescibacteria group bacterium]|jgi:hypothetical protein